MNQTDHRHRRLGIASALFAGLAALGAVAMPDDALATPPPTYSFAQTCSEADELPIITNTGTGVITVYAVMNASVLDPGESTVVGYYDPTQPDPADVTWAVGAGGFSESPTVIGGGNFAVCLRPDPTTTQPPTTQPPATQPPSTQPPATTPPATPPPATQPPATTPPATQPPATTPPATQPPATTPPATQPPATQPPATQPPDTQPPATTPPATQPPATDEPAPPAAAPPAAAVSDSSPGAGDEVVATATGFVPGESVTVVLHSTPRTLGTVTADAEGRASIAFNVLADDAPGAHRIVFTGPTTGSVSIALTISGSATLPATGGDVTTAVALAAILLAGGAVISRYGRAGG